MNVVLVHGGWQGGWTWDEVAPILRAAGHHVLAPTLRGLEEGAVNRAGLTLDDLACGLIREIEAAALRDFVVVGHSGGGPVVQLVADRFGRSVQRTVFMDAWVLLDGESINDVHSQRDAEALRASAAQSQDNTVAIDTERWSASFMQDATPEQLAATAARLVPTPLGWFDQPIQLPHFFSLHLPSSYVFLRQDYSAPSGRWREMAARLENPLIAECDGSHEAMLTRPKAVADALRSAIEGRAVNGARILGSGPNS
jgi:pimeloyl-ACP methyl ester carboxylesterase